MSVYICSICGHVEFNDVSAPCPSCRSTAEKFTRNDRIFEESAEKGKESGFKHVPSITINRKDTRIPDRSCNDITVRIGATHHPMVAAHFIRFVDCYVDDAFVARMTEIPGVFPAGCFHLTTSGTNIRVVENCTVHGYWKTEMSLR